MKRPDKRDYDFNDLFESNRYAINMTKYVNYLEKQLTIHSVVSSFCPCGKVSNTKECHCPDANFTDDDLH